jgi:hypothetical protein
MRLIDADDFRDDWRWQGQEYSPQDIIEEIDDAPTIEAIPISYLDEEIERCKKEGMEAEAYFLNEICRYWENKQ